MSRGSTARQKGRQVNIPTPPTGLPPRVSCARGRGGLRSPAQRLPTVRERRRGRGVLGRETPGPSGDRARARAGGGGPEMRAKSCGDRKESGVGRGRPPVSAPPRRCQVRAHSCAPAGRTQGVRPRPSPLPRPPFPRRPERGAYPSRPQTSPRAAGRARHLAAARRGRALSPRDPLAQPTAPSARAPCLREVVSCVVTRRWLPCCDREPVTLASVHFFCCKMRPEDRSLIFKLAGWGKGCVRDGGPALLGLTLPLPPRTCFLLF